MAERETRLEILEDEVKVLKGEVKRTPVELRALLMREDSPLGDGALGRRMATSDRGREANGTAGPKAAGPGTEAAPGLGAFSASPSQAGPGAFAGAASPPPIVIQHGGPPPGPQPSADPAALAEQERRMAEQERRMAEQETKLAQQERTLTNARPPEQIEEPSHQAIENTSQATPGKTGQYASPQEGPGTGPVAQFVSQNGQNGRIDLAEEKPVAGLEGKKEAEQPPGSQNHNERNQRANSILR
jgi:hypothetical protein